MPRTEAVSAPATRKEPAYLRHKRSGQAYVMVAGRQVYLGPYGSLESRRRYEDVLGVWRRNRDAEAPLPGPQVLVREPVVGDLILSYLRWVSGEFSPSMISNVRQASGYLRGLYGHHPIARLGATEMRALRAALVERGLARKTINKHLGLVRGMVRWGVEEGIVPPDVSGLVGAVRGIKPGRAGAIDLPPVAPVDDEIVERTLPHLHPTIAAMVRFQRLTGCRPQDVRQMTMQGLDRSGEVWIYRPTKHKTSYTGRIRVIAIGPRAQAVLGPFLRRDETLPIFTRGRGGRRGISRDYYAKSIAKACARAFPPPPMLVPERVPEWIAARRWSPNRLRHTAATQVRAAFGLEASQVVLGHARADVTQIYAERDLGLLTKVAAAVG